MIYGEGLSITLVWVNLFEFGGAVFQKVAAKFSKVAAVFQKVAFIFQKVAALSEGGALAFFHGVPNF